MKVPVIVKVKKVVHYTHYIFVNYYTFSFVESAPFDYTRNSV